ncbi:MAG: hypothetical protein EBS29_00890 [Chloroflexia bacterium]|nr:hypothetical protein [Chloroflexia bacterium]
MILPLRISVWVAWMLVLALLAPALLFAQESDVSAVADTTPYTDQLVVTLKSTANRSAVDTLFWRQFGDTAQRSGLARASYKRAMSGTRYVLKVERYVSRAEIDQLQTAWLKIADVVRVEPDVIAQITAVPNDPEYPNQWHYFSPATPVNGRTYYGIDAIGAWDQGATGDGAVVAVLDTGITPHPDLGLSQVNGVVTGNKLVGQYDFVNNATMAGDGDGRDDNARDEGDFYNLSPSSWHGTHVAGTIAALTNNGMGVAGVAGDARLLIGRVLGRGGGYSSDIADAIRWAAQLPVSGVPLAPVKANVINLSLGGGLSFCPSYYADAISDATNVGTMVVVAAGNSSLPVDQFTPANCVGAVTVAAVGPTGKRAYYSNYGSGVDIAAPGGDKYAGGNLAGGYVRSTWFNGSDIIDTATPDYGNMQGTSMATPHVVGVAALLYALMPDASVATIYQYLTEATNLTNFASDTSANACKTTTCGVGIVNAAKAVQAFKLAIPTATNTLTPSITYTPSETPTANVTRSPTRSATITPTASGTRSPTRSATATRSVTATPTASSTPSSTNTPTVSSTRTLSLTHTMTNTPTVTPLLNNTQLLKVDFDDVAAFQSTRWRLSTTMRCVTSTPVCVDEVVAGVQNKAVHLDATRANALTTVSPWAPPVLANTLVSLWVRATERNVNIMQSVGGFGAYTMTISAGKLACRFNGVTATSSIDVNDGAWHHLVCLLTPGRNGVVASYVDGYLSGSARVVTTTILALPTKLLVGVVNGAYSSFDVDELWVASGDVGTNEVQLIYNKQAPLGSTLINTQTLTPSATLTNTRTATASRTPSNTPTPTRTRTATATHTATRTRTATATLTPSLTPTTFAGMGIVNGDFEDYQTGWTEHSSLNFPIIGSWSNFAAWTGRYVAWLGGTVGGEADSVDALEQTVTVSSTNSALYLHSGFYSWESNCASDYARIYVNNILVKQWGMCNQSNWAPLTLYNQQIIDMSTWVGQTVPIRFELTNNSINPSSWIIDTVKFGPTISNTTLLNGNFANGADGSWNEDSRNNGQRTGQFIANGVAKLGNLNPPRNLTSDRITQYVTLPADAKRLLFDFRMNSVEVCAHYYDVVNITVDDNRLGRIDICKGMVPGRAVVDISGYAGKRVPISIFLTTDSALGSEVIIDNVAVSNTPVPVSIPQDVLTPVKTVMDATALHK